MKRSPSSPQPLFVGVTLDGELGFHAQIARGMARFRATRPHWTFIETEPELVESVPFPLAGMIGHFGDPGIEQAAFARKGIRHAVSITNQRPGPVPWSRVINDDRAIGRMAADYFLRRRFLTFASWGLRRLRFSIDRIEGFEDRLRRKGVQHLHRYDQADRGNLGGLRNHLPLALFAVSDLTAKSLMSHLRREGFRLPHDIALLGVDNDPHVELFTPVPLSSVETDGERIGFAACELLERKLAGGDPEPECVRIPPLGIRERASTATEAVSDPVVREIQTWIENHLADIRDMEEVARALHMHRRTLDRRFTDAVGMTPTDWLARRRVLLAEKLLVETDDTVDAIAERVGLVNRRRLNLTFKRLARPLPTTLRKSR